MIVYFPELAFIRVKRYIRNTFGGIDPKLGEKIINEELGREKYKIIIQELGTNFPKVTFEHCNAWSKGNPSRYSFIDNHITFCSNLLDEKQLKACLAKEACVSYYSNRSSDVPECIDVKCTKAFFDELIERNYPLLIRNLTKAALPQITENVFSKCYSEENILN